MRVLELTLHFLWLKTAVAQSQAPGTGKFYADFT